MNLSMRSGIAVVAAALAAGCAGPQSAIDPAGPAAQSIHQLGIVMWAGAAIVTALVTILMLVPFVRRREGPINRKLFLWGGGVALPAVTLSALVPYVMTVGGAMREPTPPGGVSVDVTGHLYWWDVSYRLPNEARAATANELRVPVGQPVEIWLRSADVIHSFWVPNLAGKTDLTPGRTTRMVIQADRPGVFRGQCAEYCGAQHSLMAFEVTAVPPPEFTAWLAKLAQPAAEPADAQLRMGRDLFVSEGCGACHTIRGVIEGRLGPDLTQVGARDMLAGGALRGGVGNIAGWIASAQHLKPGNTMPSYDQLGGPQLRALAAYLASLQ